MSAFALRALRVVLLFVLILSLTACPPQTTNTGDSQTPAAPAATNTALPPTPAPTVVLPTAVPPTATPTPLPPTRVPPSATPVPPTPTPEPPTATPTAVPPTDTPEPTATAAPAAPQVVIGSTGINARGGPGTNYPRVATAAAGLRYDIVGKNPDGTWWQICCLGNEQSTGWVLAGLVTVSGDAGSVAVAADIPTPPPAPTPVPVVQPPPTRGGPTGVLLYSVANMDAGKWELWEYNFSSGAKKMLFDWRTEVAYSPNYRQIAYYAWPPAVGNDKFGIWVMNSDYSGERLVIRGGAYPTWSPDGGRLAANGGEDIYIMGADGNGLRKLITGEYPAWSPKSNWIAHPACVGGACGIYLTDPDSGAQQRVSTGGGDGQPAWRPDGQQIAYISKDDGNFEIYRVNVDGSNRVRLTDNPSSDGLPIWSPDGAWIAFRSDRGGAWAIYVMRADGSDVRKLIDAPVLPLWFFEKMAWRP